MEIRAPSPGQLSGLEGLGTGQVRKAPVRPVCGELLIFDTAAHPICDRWALREIGLQIKPNLASRTSSFRPPERPGRAGSKRTFAITSVFQILALQLLGIVAKGLWSVCREIVSNDIGLRTLGPFLKVANNFLAQAGYAIKRLCSVGIVS
jgi:hypothetical protein